MNIAICDDEQVFLRQLHRKISELKIPDCQIHEFSSGIDLLNDFVEEMFEVIILDVEMPKMNGLEVAEKIRMIDKSVIISFLTNYAEFAVQGYEVEAFRYILKNQPEYIYKQQLSSIFEEFNQRFRCYKFCNRNMSFKFKLHDILYFEVHGRKVTLFTFQGEIEYYGDFSEICEELTPFNFVITNKGLLINLEHIQKIIKNDIILSTGKKIPMSRIYKDKVVSKYLDFTTRR